MLKKGLLFIIVLVGMVGLNTGFFNKHISMEFVKKPSIMFIVSNLHEKEINTMIQKLEQLQKQQGKEAEQAALNSDIQALYEKDVVQTDDQKTIDLLFSGLNGTNDILGAVSNGAKKSNAVIDNGSIMPPKEGLYYKVYFQYSDRIPQDTNEQIIAAVKNGYIPYIFLFPNNLAYVPVFDETQKTQISTVKVRFQEDAVKEFNKYYMDHLKK